jgi:Uma2 family endonuclease
MTNLHTQTALDAYLAMPETNRIVELINEEIVMTPPPLDVHQEVFGNLHLFLANVLQSHGGIIRLAPTGIKFDDDNVVEPDIFWIAPDNTRCTLHPAGRFWLGAPDLIIEIRSPSTALRDRREKFALYERDAVREYWLVDPNARFIEVYSHDGSAFQQLGIFSDAESFASPVLQGQTVSVQAALGA